MLDVVSKLIVLTSALLGGKRVKVRFVYDYFSSMRESVFLFFFTVSKPS